MSMEKKGILKKEFKDGLKNLASFLTVFTSTKSKDWTIKGFIDVYKNVYTISSDTKIISKILEIHIFPQILKFAEEIGYDLLLVEKQNWYPDLTFINKLNPEIMFAVDIKTTYRKKDNTAGFTLGSHGAYFKERDKSKNIQFPYNKYSGHFCLGIIYTRAAQDDTTSETSVFQINDFNDNIYSSKVGIREVTNIDNLDSITSVIRDLDFFVAEKWKIASDKQGSGNTANIGSITNIDDLKNEEGTFSKLGEDWFDDYWMNHGQIKITKDGKQEKITNLTDFLLYKNRPDLIKHIVGKSYKKGIE